MTSTVSNINRTQPRIPYVLRHCTYLSPTEYEFLTEHETITIKPLFKCTTPVKFKERTVGPFLPQLDIDVPLWVAIQLKSMKRCHIIPPRWMDPAVLKQHLQQERTERSSFGTIPYHYNELYVILFDLCIDDIDAQYGYKAHKGIQNYIREIQDERKAKILSGINNFAYANRNSVFKLNNISALELYEIRSIVVHALNTSAKLHINDVTNKPKMLESQPTNNTRQRTQPSAATTESQTRSTGHTATTRTTTQVTDSET